MPIPKNKILYEKVKMMADEIYKKPSAYKSGYIVKKYKYDMMIYGHCTINIVNELKNKLQINTNMEESEKQEIMNNMDMLKRKFVNVSKSDIENIKDLIRAYGATYYDAPGEADELCAMLTIKGKVWACLSEDMDMFVYGCPRVLRYFSLLNHTVVIYNLNEILNNLGIKGLNAEVGYMEQARKVGSTTSPSRDAQFTTAGITYVTGPISIGYNRKEFEDGKSTLETKKQDDYGIAYTVGNISYGAYYQKVDSNLSTKVDETYKALAIGYNLGPVAAMVNVGKHSDLGGTSGADMDSVTLKLRTSF
jgi:hypothetical protein